LGELAERAIPALEAGRGRCEGEAREEAAAEARMGLRSGDEAEVERAVVEGAGWRERLREREEGEGRTE
jgi:hypothetical protein